MLLTNKTKALMGATKGIVITEASLIKMRIPPLLFSLLSAYNGAHAENSTYRFYTSQNLREILNQLNADEDWSRIATEMLSSLPKDNDFVMVMK